MTDRRVAIKIAAALLLALAVLAAADLAAAQSSCIDCHTERDAEIGAGSDLHSSHLAEIRHSRHLRAGVNCDDCHGGDPKSFDEFRAHQGVLNSSNPDSLTNRKRLPATCGRCHTLIYDAFSSNPHFELLQEGDPRAPVCTTCHVSMSSQLLVPSPNRCSSCHNEESDALAPPLVGRGRELLSRMEEIGDLRRKAERRLGKVKDKARRHELEGLYFEAEADWDQAMETAHGFRWDRWESLLAKARREIETLLAELQKKR